MKSFFHDNGFDPRGVRTPLCYLFTGRTMRSIYFHGELSYNHSSVSSHTYNLWPLYLGIMMSVVVVLHMTVGCSKKNLSLHTNNVLCVDPSVTLCCHNKNGSIFLLQYCSRKLWTQMVVQVLFGIFFIFLKLPKMTRLVSVYHHVVTVCVPVPKNYNYWIVACHSQPFLRSRPIHVGLWHHGHSHASADIPMAGHFSGG